MLKGSDFTEEGKISELRMTMFTQFRDHLWTLRQSNIEKSDNLILTLSAAILGISLTFVKDIVSLERAIDLNILIIAWTLLGFTIISTLLSYWTGRNENEAQVTIAEKYYIKRDTEAFDEINPWKKRTNICNNTSSWCFSVAVVLLIFFVSANLIKEHTYLNKKKPVAFRLFTKTINHGSLSWKLAEGFITHERISSKL